MALCPYPSHLQLTPCMRRASPRSLHALPALVQACEWSVAVKGKHAANPNSKTKPNFRIVF